MRPFAEPARNAGFSLVEMLVALAIFGLAVLGLLNLAGENTRTAMVVEEGALAGVVADNRAIEAMLATPAELAHQAAGVERAGGRDWRWRRSQRPVTASLVRIEIAVQGQDDGRIAAERIVLRQLP